MPGLETAERFASIIAANGPCHAQEVRESFIPVRTNQHADQLVGDGTSRGEK